MVVTNNQGGYGAEVEGSIEDGGHKRGNLTRVTVSRSVFERSTGIELQGVHHELLVATITETRFVSNVPDGLKILSTFVSNLATLSIESCGFAQNTGYSGAIYATNSLINISNTVFVSNKGNSGGAIYVAASTLTIGSGTLFSGNSGLYGGCIYATLSNLTVARDSSDIRFQVFLSSTLLLLLIFLLTKRCIFPINFQIRA